MSAFQAIPAGAERVAGERLPGAGVGDAPGGAGPSAAAGRQAASAATGGPVSGNPSTAMVPVNAAVGDEPSQIIDGEQQPFSPVVARLPVELDVMVPVRDFRVRNLLALEPGEVIASQWGHGDDVPIAAGEVTLAWSEFEVMDTALAVRITRLS